MVMPLLHVLRLGRELTILVYGIAIAASFTAVGQVVFRSVLWHRPFVLLLTFGASLAAWVAWTRFRSDGTSQSFLIYAAFVLPLCGLLALIIRRVQQPDNGYGPGR